MKFDVKEIALKTVALAAGGVGAGILNKHLPEAIPTSIRPVIFIGLGAVVPSFIGKGKNQLINHVGNGMIAAGANQLVAQYMPSLVSGIDTRVNYVAVPQNYLENIPVPAVPQNEPQMVEAQPGTIYTV